jgi:hypothetical protein
MFKRFFILFIFCLSAFGQVRKAPPLRGTPGRHQQERQKVDGDGLSYIKDEAELDRFVAQGLLVPIPENQSIEVDKKVPVNRRYCRPWVLNFLLDYGPKYKTQYNKKLKLTSGIRTLADQAELRKHNPNASPTSTHPTGATVDISWKKMHRQEVAWFAGELFKLERAGKIQATQEHKQACFHILVLKKYSERQAGPKPPVKKAAPKKAAPKKGGKK